MALKIMLICDSCKKELDESEKIGWISYDSTGICIFAPNNKKIDLKLKGDNSIFCSAECLTKWITSHITTAMKCESGK